MNALAERLARRPEGPIHAATLLRSFTLITYRVEARALAAAVADSRFIPEPVAGGALVSAVHFIESDFRFPGLPLGRWRFLQTDYRGYVRDRRTGEPGVWLLGSALDSPLASLPRRLWGMPWHRTPHALEATADRWRWTCASGWGAGHADIRPDAGPVTVLDGFADLAAARLVLTHAVHGWYRRVDGRVGRIAIWHPTMDWRLGAADSLAHPVFARAGIPLGELHSVLTTPSIPFVIGLPPRLDQSDAAAATPDSQAPSTRGRSP